jgi:CheY-like chemotaxis protein
LSIVRHLVELHGGTVTAQSEGEGRGALFTIRVPVAAPRTASLPSVDGSAPLGEMPLLEGVTVLVVEDEADARALVITVLEACKARVVVAESVSAALQLIQTAPPDVLVSDIAMPGEDGYALIKKLRTLEGRGPHLPAAALTAFATAIDRARALLAGYQAHVAKPVDPAELAAVVATLAGRTAVRN